MQKTKTITLIVKKQTINIKEIVLKIAKTIIQAQTIIKTVMIIIAQIDLEITKIMEIMKIAKETIDLIIAKEIIGLIITAKMEIINLITKIETDKDHLIEIMEDL